MVVVRSMGWGMVVALATAHGLVACTSPDVRWCGDVLCPSSLVCAPIGEGCVDPDQVAACDGVDDDDACELPGVGPGLCRDGLCIVAICGDGVRDPDEGCDDGALNGPDAACLADCKRPTCGDGAMQGDEACDDGAGNADDRACLPTCVAASCGDGRVWVGQEACDTGLSNADDAACTNSCVVASCGDGLVWAGVEACDDANQLSGDGCRADCSKLEVCGDGVVDEGEGCDDGAAGLANPADGCDACAITAWTASVVVGEPPVGTEVYLQGPSAVALGRDGALYIVDQNGHRVLRQDRSTGQVIVVAGTGVAGAGGDGGLSTAAQLSSPSDVAIDGRGDVWISDTQNHRVRRIDADTGIITTVAGTGSFGFSGDGGPAALAAMSQPMGLCIDRRGDVFVAERGNRRVRRIRAADGTIATVAGATFPSPTHLFYNHDDGGLAIDASVAAEDVACGDDVLYIATPNHRRVRQVDLSTGIISTLAGFDNGTGPAGDGGPAAAASLWTPRAVAVAPDGSVLIADSARETVRRVTFPAESVPQIDTLFGVEYGRGYTLDGELAAGQRTGFPVAVEQDPSGVVYVVEEVNGRVRTIGADGRLGTAIGGDLVATRAAGAPAMATPSTALTLALREDGTMAVSNGGTSVTAIDLDTGRVDVLIGSGRTGVPTDGDLATGAAFTSLWAVVAAPGGDLYVSSRTKSAVYRVTAAGQTFRFAGTGSSSGSLGDGGPALAARVAFPMGLARDAAGNLFIGEAFSTTSRVRRVDPDGTITTYAGTGTAGHSGDGGLATDAQIQAPRALAVGPDGALYIVGESVVRRVDPVTSIITTVAGTGVVGFGGDGGPGPAAQLALPLAALVTPDERLLIADCDNDRVRAVDLTSGQIDTIVGTGLSQDAGEGVDALAADVDCPRALALAADGALIVGTPRGLRRVDPATNQVTTIAGAMWPVGIGELARASLATPAALEVIGGTAWIAAGAAGVVERIAATAGDDGALEAVIGRFAQAVATGDRARYRETSFGTVHGVAIDEAGGRVFVAETSAHRVHVVDLAGQPDDPDAWTISELAGGVAGFADGPPAMARFREPRGLFFDAATQALLVVDSGNHAVRRVDLLTGEVTTLVGQPETLGFFGDGGAAGDALLDTPLAVTRCAATGDLFIADTGNHRVRRVDAVTDVITTVLGDGVAASSGEGAPAWTFPVNAPADLACDAYGNLFVTSSTAVRLLPADATGIVDGSAAVQTIYGAAPRDAFPASVTRCLTGLAVVDDHTTWVADACVGMLVELWRQPID